MAIDIYTPTALEKAPKRYRYIVLHDTNCQWKNYNTYKVDSKSFQTGSMKGRCRSDKHIYDVPYHFICEKIGDNYQTVLGRPLQYSCERSYPDMDNRYAKFSIHVCIMGNYNIMAHQVKMYEQLCYRVLCPMMRDYRIAKSKIFLHGELSKEHLDCPGFGFNKQIMFAYMTKYLQGTTT